MKDVSRSVGSDLLLPTDCSPPGSSVHGILQARIVAWVAISFSRGSSTPRDQTPVSCSALQADFLPSEPPGKFWATSEASNMHPFLNAEAVLSTWLQFPRETRGDLHPLSHSLVLEATSTGSIRPRSCSLGQVTKRCLFGWRACST